MRNLVLLICVTGIILATSCENKDIETPEIRITLLDDVTPLQVKFDVEDKWEAYDWFFNDTLASADPLTNQKIMEFHEPGISKVNLTVYGNSTSKRVSKVFTLPQRPSIIEIYGFTADEDFKAQTSNDSILYFDFKYYNVDTTFGQRVMRLIKNDSIYLFDKSICFNYSDFLLGSDKYGALLDFKIYNQEKDKLILSMPLYNKYKRDIIDRNLTDGGLKEMQLTYLGNGFFLNIDLKP